MITIEKHPEDIIEVDPEIIENMKRRLANKAPMSQEERERNAWEDFITR